MLALHSSWWRAKEKQKGANRAKLIDFNLPAVRHEVVTNFMRFNGQKTQYKKEKKEKGSQAGNHLKLTREMISCQWNKVKTGTSFVLLFTFLQGESLVPPGPRPSNTSRPTAVIAPCLGLYSSSPIHHSNGDMGSYLTPLLPPPLLLVSLVCLHAERSWWQRTDPMSGPESLACVTSGLSDILPPLGWWQVLVALVPLSAPVCFERGVPRLESWKKRTIGGGKRFKQLREMCF